MLTEKDVENSLAIENNEVTPIQSNKALTAELLNEDEKITDNSHEKDKLLVKKKRNVSSVLKEFCVLSVPYTINGIAINGSFFLNTLILSQLGTDTLAATGLATSTQLLTIASAKAILSSTSVMIARNSSQPQKMGAILKQSWLQSLIETVPIVILFVLSEDIFNLMGQDPTVAKISGDYLSKYSLAVPAVLLLKSSEQFAIAVKYPNLVLFTNLLNTSATAALTYILALGKLGSPQLGVSGSAYAAALSTWLSFFALTAYFYCNPKFSNYNIFNCNGIKRFDILKSLFSIGYPIGIQTGIEFVYNFSKSIVAGILGEESLGADQIVTQYTSLILSPIFAVSTINGILVGNDIHENNSINIKLIGNSGIIISMIVPSIGLLLFVLAPKELTDLFVSEDHEHYEDILTIAKYLFLINGVNNIIDAIKNSSAGALRAFYDTAIPTIIMLSSLWVVGVPSSFSLAFPAKLGISGFFIGRGLSLFTSVPPLLYRWKKSYDDPQKAIQNSKKSVLNQMNSFFGCKNRNRGVIIEYAELEVDNEQNIPQSNRICCNNCCIL